jgi:GNAT superfamily N-acetyltransferase
LVRIQPGPLRVVIRDLPRSEFRRVGEIDRTERIGVVFEQHGTELITRRADHDAAPWVAEGNGEHSVAAQRRALEAYADALGTARGAFAGRRLIGIGMVVPHIRPAVAQLAYLHVSDGFRATGVGGRLVADVERIAREAGDTAMVVTATPTENTVRFYMGRGFRPMGYPLPELFELEPDDIHMQKAL